MISLSTSNRLVMVHTVSCALHLIEPRIQRLLSRRLEKLSRILLMLSVLLEKSNYSVRNEKPTCYMIVLLFIFKHVEFFDHENIIALIDV